MIDLQKFCSTRSDRKSICQPWSEGEWTYATDGRVIVRVPRRADVPENPDAPKNVNKTIFDCNPNDGKFQPLPTFTAPKKVTCDNCGGDGQCVCSACDAQHDCGCCKGTGTVLETLPGVKFGNQLVNPKYLALIADLPSAVLANGTKKYETVTFKFDGGEGRLMPMRES